MTHVYSAPVFGSIYRQQLRDLVERPDYIVTVRGRPTRELLNVVTEITNPRARCQIVPGRRLNPWLALSESLWMLAGRNDVAALEPYNKNIRRFSDDGEILYGAYGYRIKDQIEPMLARLLREDTDRAAVLQIWNSHDLIAQTKDRPCNQRVAFKLRNDRLHMIVTCRSNDLHWGLAAVNTFQFGILQEYLATRLGCGVGTQTHFSESLHIYTDAEGQKITDRMMAAMDEPLQELPPDELLFPNPFPQDLGYSTFAALCGVVLDGVYGRSIPNFPFLEFAEDFLRIYREKSAGLVRHQLEYSGWVK